MDDNINFKDFFWCPLPFNSLSSTQGGKMRLCCHANQGPNKGELKKEDGTNYNFREDNISEAFNCDLLKDTRSKMLKGEQVTECIRCIDEEKYGMDSRRLNEIEDYGSNGDFNGSMDYRKAKEITNDDGSIDIEKIEFQYFDFRLGNKCNLKCVMCAPSESSLWYDDYVALSNNTKFNVWGESVELEKIGGSYKVKNKDIFNWYTSESFINQIEKNGHNLKKLYLIGGEPLLIKEQYQLLKLCVEKGWAKNISIEYNTNGISIPNYAWDLWKEFKSIHIGISVDGTQLVNEYIRFPSNWDDFYKNLKLIDNSDDNITAWLTSSISAYNILDIPDFFIWICKENFKKISHTSLNNPIILRAHQIHSPLYLNIKNYPKEFKEEVLKYYEENWDKWIDEIKSIFPNTKQQARIIKRFTKLCNGFTSLLRQNLDFVDEEKYIQFINYTKRLEQLRGNSINTSIPELARILKYERY